MLVRNPAIKIIGKRNEREGGSWSSSAPSTQQAETSSTMASCCPAAAAPQALSNQDSGSTGNGKPEPQWSSSTTAALLTTSSSAKEEASSRLEALLKSTSACPKPAKNKSSEIKHDLKDHLVKFEAVPKKSLTDLWTQSHTQEENADKAGKRYRSSIRIMVRPEAVAQLQKPIRANSSDGFSRSASSSSSVETARSAKKLSAAGVRNAAMVKTEANSSGDNKQPQQRPIVKEQFR